MYNMYLERLYLKQYLKKNGNHVFLKMLNMYANVKMKLKHKFETS